MSKGSRIAIGIVALVCAIGFFMTALDPSGLPAGSNVFYGMTALCITVAIACFFPKSHPITLRMIGATIFFSYADYIIDSFHTQNLVRAIAGFFVWGLPSGYLAITGKYPSWGKVEEVFNAEQNNKQK